MITRKRIADLLIVVLLLSLSACGNTSITAGGEGETPEPLPAAEVTPPLAPTRTFSPVDPRDAFAFEQNRRLGRGVNLGNALEAPREGQWGVVLEEDFFSTIKAGGFDSVRVPIRWNAHAAQEAPYTIDPAFFDRVDWVVEIALANDLSVALNVHHYEEIMTSPRQHEERFMALWQQIAAHYQDAPDGVFFEPLNEPNGFLVGSVWNNLAARVIHVIRETNPRRTIIIGPGDWNALTSLRSLKLPEDDRNLIVTIHYYQPFNFTHQGAEWVDNMDRYLGTTWTGTPSERQAVDRELDLAARWGEQNSRPVYLGEFGAYSKADMDSRALWTSYIARQAEARGMSWAYWEFCAGFGVYDPVMKDWVAPLHESLIP